jgi:aldose 1-epimerase
MTSLDPSPTISPTGEQWAIAHGRQQVIVTEVGATLRSYRVGDDEMLDGFGANEWSESGRGQVLAPWPNRLGDGRYEFGGIAAQAPLNEPELGNAIHGLVRWLPWRCEVLAQNVMVVRCTIWPTPAYPFLASLGLEYRLGREGLAVTATVRNEGSVALPFGLGFHPYLRVGTDRVDTATLLVPARQRLVLDARSLPTGEARPVGGTEFDFSQGRAIGPTQLDTAYTDLERDGDGVAWASIADPSGERAVDLWVDQQFRYLMVYTGDTIGAVDRRRQGLAIEPMTCPPDAFRSGRDLVVLEPGQEWTAAWGIRPR